MCSSTPSVNEMQTNLTSEIKKTVPVCFKGHLQIRTPVCRLDCHLGDQHSDPDGRGHGDDDVHLNIRYLSIHIFRMGL